MSAAAPESVRPAFVFDAARCTGCDACQVACTVENGLPWGTSWRRIATFNAAGHPEAARFHLSLACQHCARARCAEACPAGAIERDPGGAVRIDAGRCIGCRYCAWACPFDAPRHDPAAGVMTKCTLCAHRLRDGREPACASLCPTGALSFARLPEEALGHDVEGLAGADLGPALRIEPGSVRRAPPAGLIAAGPGAETTAAPPARGQSLRSEWALLAFTFLAALLVAVQWSGALGGPRLDAASYGAAWLLAFALATAHLGRPWRAWRALRNLRASWLSREIALLGAFALAATATLAAPGRPALAIVATSLLGLVALLVVDRVYALAVAPPHARPHPASAVFMALFMAGALAGEPRLALTVGAIQLALLARRARGERGLRRPALDGLRVGVGFLLPLVLWGVPGWRAAAIGGALLGQLLDRAGFYLDLEFPTPQRALDEALARRLAAARAPVSAR